MKNLFRWGNIILLIAMILVNMLANFLPLGGKTTGEISANYPTLFTPAAYTFSIWGIIYILMSIFALYTTIISPDDSSMTEVRESVGLLFILSCLFNIAWIFCWHYMRLNLSVVCMVCLLITLIMINQRFTINRPDVPILYRVSVYGFNIYLGWICAATIANIGVFIKQTGWDVFGISEQILTIAVLIVTCIIGISFSLAGGRFMASFALLWAIAGIFVRHISTNGYNNQYPAVTITLGCVFIIILLSIILSPFVNTYEYIPAKQDQY